MAKKDEWIDNRALEIWCEKVCEQKDYAYLKALSQAAREWRQRQGKMRQLKFEVRQIGWLEYT
jgi:hypothetical protein